jgi:hypothetical protein
MPKKPEPPKPISWNVYKIAAKAVQLGAAEATCDLKRKWPLRFRRKGAGPREP